MHHELFLALLGHTGDVIERRSDGFFVRADADFLSQAQKSVLNRLLRLGFAFSYLDQFVRQAATFPSVYLHALAQAVERQLQRYSDAVVALEAKILRSRAMFPLSNLMFELEEFMEVLPELCALVSKLQGPTEPQSASCIRGSKLLSVIHRSSSSGFPRVRTCMQELLYACHRALFKQILSWMIYGEIVDPYGEFFIKKRAAVGSDGKTVSSYGNNAALLWHQQFSIDLESVPLDYFPTAVAESVFEIGKAVHILSKANEFTPREEQDIINAVSELAQRPVFDVITVEHAVEKVRRHVASRLHEEVVVKSDFVGYLHVLKGFFLLSRGEVFQTFIERSFDMMLAKPTTKSEEDVNHGIWREILRELVSEDEMWSRDFDMQLPLQTFRLKGFSSNDALALSNISRGPNGKFLAVNSARVAHALELAWKSNTLRSKGGVRNNASFAASALRIRMSFVVRTLELYFQVFVIENKFKKCVAQIGSAGDFDRAKRLHETFVASVVKSCYVHTKTVASALDELLGCCWQFAEYVLQHDVISDGGCELSADRVALLDQDFHRRYEFLYSVLQISEARDLLFLLDSNGFFAAERERRKRQLQ
ncbi:Gamma-tubulin complex component 4 [Phytophthora boehmeriae]|uniref:Spindle pole body component n=1 Tax=Phytophthora boehmeriae TaxID=109152 RepID=A0A8T1X730_9STRA|nr:Gamma-tubulin complex component 4 [Phytophthora boehmeriae]